VAEAGQRASSAFVVARGGVVEHQGSVFEVARRELGLDPLLASPKPVEGLVKLVDVRIADREFFGQGGATPQPRGGQLGAGRDQTLRDHGHDQVALARGLGGNQAVQIELSNGAEDGLHVAVGDRVLDREGVLGADERFATEQALEGLDLVFGPVCEVSQGTGLDLAVQAVALTQEDGWGGATVGDRGDVHAHI
jgi:hypothetical protein